MVTDVLIDLSFNIFFLTLLGFFMRKRGIMDDNFQNRLSKILVDIVIPLNILAAGSSQYDAQLASGMGKMAVITIAYYVVTIVLISLLSRALPLEKENRGQFTNIVVFANVGFIGLPIIQSLYGNEGLLYAVVGNLLFQFIVFTYGVYNVGGKSMGIKGFLTSVSTVVPVLAILLFVSPLSLPRPVLSTFQLIGSMSAPFSLFIIGSSLATIKFSSLWTSGMAWLATALRQVAIPLCLAVVLKLLGFSGILPAACVVVFGLPSATLNVIFAQQYGKDTAFATRAVSQGVICMFVTLPLSVLLCSRWFF